MSGPPMSPCHAVPRGTRRELYIRQPSVRPFAPPTMAPGPSWNVQSLSAATETARSAAAEQSLICAILYWSGAALGLCAVAIPGETGVHRRCSLATLRRRGCGFECRAAPRRYKSVRREERFRSPPGHAVTGPDPRGRDLRRVGRRHRRTTIDDPEMQRSHVALLVTRRTQGRAYQPTSRLALGQVDHRASRRHTLRALTTRDRPHSAGAADGQPRSQRPEAGASSSVTQATTGSPFATFV